MRTLYACILADESQAKNLLDDVSQWCSDGTLVTTQFTRVEYLEGHARLQSSDNSVGVRVEFVLSPSERPEWSAWTLLIEVNDLESQEFVAACWDILVAISTVHQLPFWLSRACFDEESLRKFGAVRPLLLSLSEPGFLLSAGQIDNLISSKG
jgi:hypothetical protein